MEKNLKKFYIGENYKELNLSISNLCPNLKSLFLLFYKNEFDSLKTILINCQYLESIKIWCEVSVEDLEAFFLSWKDRIPKKLLSLITIKDYCKCLDDYEENMEIIEKYENLGIVRFRTISYEVDEREEEEFYCYN
ncbi:hypothetical protein GLOIN_2v1715049 [Rhizophagus clarus]|uniref:Uncharacterized protein n=1 Tax=Rhizophagus clarus TaxID=94130 RepID=A0A8H3LT22_9GLOM|nr:hypothetical protein GLOIN_2v1715049 [Rhizophagus clarus]